ncbi:MAG TPA: LuxR C-terminal-related transcriptional regulator [Microlunatus sp.]|nr:LuxR C-terminal-related transcriptional regulator [Microlunatus sp.]
MVPGPVGVAAPGYFTRFVGRSSERVAINELLAAPRPSSAPRLLTLVGPGGMGKTRLAAEITASSASTSPAGPLATDVCGWADLGPLSDAGELPHAVATAVGLPHAVGADLVSSVARFLRPGRRLLVLDGCERLARSSARLAETLLDRCPELAVLATSRVDLGSPQGRVISVPPLGIDGRRLFLDRARATSTGADPSPTIRPFDALAVDALCRAVGGSPLAIELLAGWSDRCHPLDLLDALATYSGGPGAAEPMSPLAVLEILCARLDEPERRVLRGFGAFAADITLEAAIEVAGADLASLAVLTRRSIIDRVPSEATCYRLHPVVRQQARRLLRREPTAMPEVRARHLRHQIAHAERAGVEDGPAPIAGATQSEYRVALAWGQVSGDEEAVLRLLAALHRRGALWQPTTEFGRVLETVVAAPDGPLMRPTAAGAGALEAAGWAAAECGDHILARRRFAAAAAAYERLQAFPEQAAGLRGVGRAHLALGDPSGAAQPLDESLCICRRVSDLGGAGWSHLHLADAAAARGRPREAARLLQRAVDDFGRAGVAEGLCRAWVGLGRGHAEAGRLVDAVEAYGRALAQTPRRPLAVEVGDLLVGLADVAVRLRESRHAGSLIGAAQAWGDAVGQTDDSAERRHRVAVALWGGDARASTDAVAGLDCPDVLRSAELAVHELTQVCRRRSAGVTAREVEVLRLVAEGLSNGAIASRLALSPRTVHAHLRSTYDKLGVGSRTTAVRAAETNGLL